MLNSILDNKDVDRQVAVQDVILGTSITGTAHVVGKPGVKLTNSPDQADFQIVLHGTVHSRTTGLNGPAIIHSRSVTQFTATKQVVFEPGKGFYGLPAKVHAQTQVVIEGIDSTRGGLIGGIVRRRAGKMEAGQHAQATEIARQKAEHRIVEAFERTSEQRLARLNRVGDFRNAATAALRATGSGEPKYTCSTTPYYLQIATSFGPNGSAIKLPVGTVADSRGPAIELWVHESLLSDRLAGGLNFVSSLLQRSDLLNAVSATAQLTSGRTDLTPFASLFNGDQIGYRKAGAWQVVDVEMSGGRPRAVAQLPAPAVRTVAAVTPRVERNYLTASNPQPSNSQPSNSQPTNSQPTNSQPTNSQPTNPGPRIWTSGNYTANAEFLALEGGLVKLRRATGINASIPLEKLSTADQVWIRTYLAQE